MSPKQLTYEDVKVGMEIPPLVKETSPRMSAEWAGASGDYDPIHYDREYAKKRRFPDAVVNGRLKVALLIQLILKKLGCRHRGVNIIGELVLCKGTVIKKYLANNEHLVDCEIWMENPRGEKTAPGEATVMLPSRG